MSAPQLLKQTEALKTTASETSKGSTEAWIARQTLQEIYQKVLVLDLEYALDKKVEQDLWNFAFKSHISMLQSQAKDRQNMKRAEAQCSLDLFLQTASGYYLQLLEELCSTFHLNLPFRKKAANIGILNEYGPLNVQIRQPKKNTAYYICQHCLVHLGDIARYRQETDQAQTYYKHAAQLVPYNGQPYNQLAILEAAKGNKLSTIFYYVRATAVKYPFSVASTNMEKLLQKLAKDSVELKSKLSMSETISTFLQMHALLHLTQDLPRAKLLSENLIASLPMHITSMSFSSYQLIQMIAITLFTMHHATSVHTEQQPISNGVLSPQPTDSEITVKLDEEMMSSEEKLIYDIAISFTVSMFELLLLHTPKQEIKAREYHTLPAIRLLLLWIHTDPTNIMKKLMNSAGLWASLSKLLNNLQTHAASNNATSDLQKYSLFPLPEDWDLQAFLPLAKSHEVLGFEFSSRTVSSALLPDIEVQLRCQRIIEQGLWICEEFPSLNLLNVQKLKSGKLQFSTPLAQVRIAPGSDGGKQNERKTACQNVAIQAILQNKAKKQVTINENPIDIMSASAVKESLKSAKGSGKEETSPGKADAGVMAHSGREQQIDQLSKNNRNPVGSMQWRPHGLPVQQGPLIPSYPWHGDGSVVRNEQPTLSSTITNSAMVRPMLASNANNSVASPRVMQQSDRMSNPFTFNQINPTPVNQTQNNVNNVLPGQTYQNPPVAQPFPSHLFNVQQGSPFMQYRLPQPSQFELQFLSNLQQNSEQNGPQSDVGHMQQSFPPRPPNPSSNYSLVNSQNTAMSRIQSAVAAGDSASQQPKIRVPLPVGYPMFNQPPPMILTPNQNAAALTAVIQQQQQQQRTGGGLPQNKDPMSELPAPYVLQNLFGQGMGTAAKEAMAYGQDLPMTASQDKVSDQRQLPRLSQFDIQNALSAQTGLDAQRMAMAYSFLSERNEVPKPDSPPPADRSLYYPNVGNAELGSLHQSSNSYSLFNQSMWSNQVQRTDDGSSSGYGSIRLGGGHILDSYSGSQSSSVETWPSSPMSASSASGSGYDYPTNNKGLWGVYADKPMNIMPDGVTKTATNNPNMQNLWMEGQSPLRKLLEQQKGHRQPEPR